MSLRRCVKLIPDSESEEWMMTGMAVRMAIDLGLHLVRCDLP